MDLELKHAGFLVGGVKITWISDGFPLDTDDFVEGLQGNLAERERRG